MSNGVVPSPNKIPYNALKFKLFLQVKFLVILLAIGMISGKPPKDKGKLKEVIQLIKDEKIMVAKASNMHGIPRSTLRYYVEDNEKTRLKKESHEHLMPY